MSRPFLLTIAVCSVLSAFVQGADSSEVADPVIGRWRWTDKQIVECKADNTFTVTPTDRSGRWKFLPGTTVERKYAFTWDEGLFVDTMVMSSAKEAMKGKNQEGKPIVATKLK